MNHDTREQLFVSIIAMVRIPQAKNCKGKLCNLEKMLKTEMWKCQLVFRFRFQHKTLSASQKHNVESKYVIGFWVVIARI